MEPSIFRPAENFEAKESRYNFIHYAFKARFFMPLIKICDKFLAKFMVKEKKDIPDRPENINLQIIWDSFEESIEEYWFKFKGIHNMYDLYKEGKLDKAQEEKLKIDLYQWIKKEKSHWYMVPKTFIKLLSTIYLEDTAYREMVNFFAFKLQANMNKQWDPEIQHKFPMYTSPHDGLIPYFLEWTKMANKEGKIEFCVKKNEKEQAGEMNERIFIAFDNREEFELVSQFMKSDVYDLMRKNKDLQMEIKVHGVDKDDKKEQSKVPENNKKGNKRNNNSKEN